MFLYRSLIIDLCFVLLLSVLEGIFCPQRVCSILLSVVCKHEIKIFMFVGVYTSLHHCIWDFHPVLCLIAESIMVRHMKLILVLSLPLRVYYLMRCAHNALWGVIINSFVRTLSYFGCVSSFWQDLQDLILLDGMCIPFQYFTDLLSLWDLSG